MTGEAKTIVFEKGYGVSIGDFEDTIAIDRFIESKIGRPLEVTDRRTSLTLRGGNVFGLNRETRESLDSAIDESMKAVDAQIARIEQGSKY